MKLFFRKFGTNNPPLIIVHGLYGMSDNWVAIAKVLSEQFEVFVIDQRNHGNSPHSNEHNYNLLQEDLHEFMQDQEIENPVLIGHSMGGKTVMNFAINYPEKINALIVVDISPRRYNSAQLTDSSKKHMQILNAMNKINLADFNKRDDIKEHILKTIKEERIVNFILKNLKRETNSFKWKLNIKAIINNLEDIIADLNITDEISGFPTLFVRGKNSNYILDEDISFIEEKFPVAEIETIKNAGHWIHAEQPKEFIRVVEDFLEN